MDIILVGSGGCMRELAWQIIEDNKIKKKWNILGYVDENYDKDLIVEGQVILYLGTDDYILEGTEKMNVVVSVGSSKLRKKIVEKYRKNPNVNFPNIILSSSKYCSDNIVGIGSIITTDTMISTNVKLGNFVFVNTGAMICHDCSIGDYVTLGPRAQIAGGVSVGDNVEIGMNATVIQCLKIEKDVTVGAGTVVIRNVEKNSLVVGVPARKVN